MSVGLLLSLAPHTSLVSHGTDDVVDAVGPVWPDQSVEQLLDQGLEVVSEVRIWAAAESGRGEAPIVAALLQGPDHKLVRQVAVRIVPSKLLRPYILEFPPYEPVRGEALILQLWVSNERSGHAIFGTREPRDDIAGPTLNRNPTDQGPLAYELIWRGHGWRAALAGSWLDILRLAGGVVAAALAVLLRPGIARRLSKTFRRTRAAALIIGKPAAAKLSLGKRWIVAHRPPRDPASTRRTLYVFPWLIPASAILHFLATNLILIRAYEAIVPSAAIMAVVTVVFIALRSILNGAAPAALMTGILAIVFFSYGHIYVADWTQPDRRLLLGIALPIILGIGLILRGRTALAHHIGQIFNFGCIVLILFPLFQLASVPYATITNQNERDTILSNTADIDNHLTQTSASIQPADLRDIYYIVLDGYPSSKSLEPFDNEEFLRGLESRGFYVDPHARSNYSCTVWSITSSLNMSYISDDDLCAESLVETYRLYNATLDHALGAILTSLGYNYTHVSSGWRMTATNRNAHQIVEFTPQGRVVTGYTDYDPGSLYQYFWQRSFSLSNRFMSEFAKTTLAKAFHSLSTFESEDRYAYSSTDPYRALDWLDYMQTIGTIESPKFVFTHLVNPHSPYSFDQYGNIATGAGWSDTHDPDVDSAFHGQIIWLNARMLETIDAILAVHDREPIIVIMSDHGREYCSYLAMCHDILAAYLLPDGGDKIIYPSITSVNVFRSILRHYFGIELDRLKDEIFISAG